MNEKQKLILAELLTGIDDPYHAIFLELAEYAVSLGYNPVRNKTHDVTIDFRKNKIKKTIMKMEAREQKHDGYQFGERNIPGLRLRFYASKNYSDIFKKGIQRVIEDFDGRYTGCYGCGRCDSTEGYTYVYPDGRKVFRCGSDLVSIFDFAKQDIPEIKLLMKNQADFYHERLEVL
jgi:hypothetical protein